MQTLRVFFATAFMLSTLITQAAPVQVCIGGGDHKDIADLPAKAEAEQAYLDKISAAKPDSHELYIRWSMVEPKHGEYDFSYLDALMEVDARNSIKVVPFLITGPAYALPHWFYNDHPDKLGYVCLEHNKESDIQSLWNPAMRKYVAGVYRAYGAHYKNSKNIEATLLGVSGNYGETLVPASEPDWTQDLHGPYHAHKGWWVGDKYAVKSYQDAVAKAYPEVNTLNREWGTTFTSISEATPRLFDDWGTTTAQHFQARWMLDSMTEYARYCMEVAAREISGDKYLVVGGHAPSYHGFDASAQCKDAAELGIGIRITNENDFFEHNFSVTRIVSTACRQYGTYFGYEPAGPVTDIGIAGRVFNAVSSGVRQLHWYEPNLLATSETLAKWEESRPFLKKAEREPVIEIAAFYPRRWMDLQGDETLVQMYQDFGALRNAFDLDLADERMLNDHLTSESLPWKYLLVREDHLVHPESKAVIEAVQKSATCSIIHFSKDIGDDKGPRNFLKQLSKKLAPEVGFQKHVYVSRMKDGGVLFLNQSEKPVRLHESYPNLVKEPIVMAPYTLVEVKEGRKI